MKIEKKSLIFGFGGVLLLLAGFAIGRISTRKELTPQPTPTAVPSPAESSTPSLTQEIFKVTRVIDGDTIYTYPPDIKHQAEILAAEAEAREADRGLWGACPIVSPTVLPTEAPTSDCNIKGNINTSGEKIYHLPGCGSYSKTKIDESRGERWFCTEEQAQAAGWRKALNCP